MYIHSYTRAQFIALQNRGIQYLSVQKHELDGISAGTVLGRHQTYDAACRKAGPSSFRTVVDIADAIADAMS